MYVASAGLGRHAVFGGGARGRETRLRGADPRDDLSGTRRAQGADSRAAARLPRARARAARPGAAA
jgi:hypothetical protein